MGKNYSSVALVTTLSLVLVLSACTPASTTSPTPTKTTTKGMEEKTQDHRMGMMEMPGELSAQEASKYKTNLPLTERIQLAEELAMKMPRNGMKQMAILFPDLTKATEIADKDPRNMMKMGPEAFYTSKEAGVTIQVCIEANSPMHLYKTLNPTDQDVKDAMKMMESMMQDHGSMEMK